jgi:tetratricopeptide (TPR) repeat protein
MVDNQKQLEEAYRLHQQGKLDDAARLYEKLVKQNPNNLDAIHFLGILKAQSGHLDEARRLVERSLATESVNLSYLENYASILFQSGDYAEAAKVCASAAGENRRSETLQYVLAVSLHKSGRLTEALAAFDSLLRLSPLHLAGNNEKAATLFELKRYDEALASVEKALKINPRYAEAYLNKGNILAGLKNYNDSVIAYEAAVSLNSKLPDVHIGLAYACRQLRRFDRALAAYDDALALWPDFADAWIGRGNAFIEMDRFEQALAAYDKALSLDQNAAEAWVGRGNALVGLKDPEHAFAAFDKGLLLNPASAAAWIGRGNAFNEIRRYADALAAFDSAINIDPALADAYFFKALVELCIGNFASGWDNYEWRSEAKEYVSHYPHLKSLRVAARQEQAAFVGKRVAVFSEQGVGDEIMFASILPDLIKDAKTVFYQVDPRLMRLFGSAFPNANIIARGGAASGQVPEEDFDMVIQAGSLGYAYRRDVAAFPRAPYLKAESIRTDKWQETLTRDAGARLKIGISWRGGTARTRRDDRSIDLERLRSLIERDDCYFVSLQYGNVNDELARFNSGSGKVHSLLDDFSNFDEFAALISALDLVISVQNTTIHMCGALGKPCWGMIPWRPEWRYGDRDKNMVWYSAVELFRQKEQGDWGSVVNSVNSNLTTFIGGRGNDRTN